VSSRESRIAVDEQSLSLARRWVDAFNRRDADALVEIADPAIAVHPTRLFRHRDFYTGHDGIRDWVAATNKDFAPEHIEVIEVRHQRSGAVLVVGQLTLGGRPVSPLTALMSFHDGALTTVHAYLSDEDTLRRLGHIDP
jgi:ketosteroid isomerase-like protein